MTVEVLVGRLEGTESGFFRRNGGSAGMSVTVYLRTGESGRSHSLPASSEAAVGST